jgi:hypothetical protein
MHYLTENCIRLLLAAGVGCILVKKMPDNKLTKSNIALIAIVILLVYVVSGRIILASSNKTNQSGEGFVDNNCDTCSTPTEHFADVKDDDSKSADSEESEETNAGTNADTPLLDAPMKISTSDKSKVDPKPEHKPDPKPEHKPDPKPEHKPEANTKHNVVKKHTKPEFDGLLGNFGENPNYKNYADKDEGYNDMPYTDFYHVPVAAGYKSKAYEYGYSYIPPEKWFPERQPLHPPVCVTDKRAKVMPSLTDGAPVDMKEWYDSTRITGPQDINTDYIAKRNDRNDGR